MNLCQNSGTGGASVRFKSRSFIPMEAHGRGARVTKKRHQNE